MDRIEYIKKATQHGAPLYKSWIIDCFTKTKLPDKPDHIDERFIENPGLDESEIGRYSHEEYPYQMFNYNGKPVFYNPEIKSWDTVDVGEQPYYQFKEPIDLKPGDLANLKENVKTQLANLLVNYIVLVYPFGAEIPFQSGKFKVKSVERLIAEKVRSVPTDGKREMGVIYADILEEYYYKAVFSLTGWMQFAVPSATPVNLVFDPEIHRVRDELLKKHKHELNNPEIVAKILAVLIQMDKDYQAKDPEAGYLQPGKSFDVARARQFLMYGLEYDFTDKSKVTLIERSLIEGWDMNQFPSMVNSLIDGSFYRGAMTALGGEAAKFLNRFFLNTNLTMEDCGATVGLPRVILPGEEAGYISGYYIEQGKSVEITPENIKGLVGRDILVRSPQCCLAGDANLCVRCLGGRYRETPNAPAGLATNVGSVLMYIFMKKTHGQALKTTRWDWKGTVVR